VDRGRLPDAMEPGIQCVWTGSGVS